jgi:molybdopterin molybdotransferase
MASERTPDWLAPGEALDRVLSGVEPLGFEELPLLECLGGVLAEEVVAPLDLPPWDNSAMDGFAVRGADVAGASADAPRRLRVVGEISAGRLPERGVGAGEALRISTGAPLPPGADTVVRVEHTAGGDGGVGWVEVRSDADAGRNVRPRGEDVRSGERVLAAGSVLRPGAIALAASVGRGTLRVVRRPVVAVLGSGDELVAVEEFARVAGGGRIVSSNSYALAASLAESGMRVRLLGIARDTPESLAAHLAGAAGCDALVTSGGVGPGAHDHVPGALASLGTTVAFWRVRVRPGSALAFGTVAGLGGIPWFGLPGNPVSTQVTFALFVRPALLRMAGHAAVHLPTVRARLAERYDVRGDVLHLPRVRLEREGSDGFVARLTGAQGSGVASSMAAADGIAVLDGGRSAAAGDAVPVVVLGGSPPVHEPPFGLPALSPRRPPA